MAVDGYNSVGVLVDHDSVGIHAEGPDVVLEFLRPVDDLALVEGVCKMGEYSCRKLDPDSDVNSVGKCVDIKVLADLLDPLASAAADGYDAFLALEAVLGSDDLEASVDDLDFLHRFQEAELDLVLHLVVEVLKDDEVDVRSQVSYRCIHQFELVDHAKSCDVGTCCGVKLCAFSAVGHVDMVDILHQTDCLFLSDVLAKCSAEIICDVVFSVRECSGTAETGHDGAGFAAYAGLDVLSVDGALPLLQGVSHVYDGDLKVLVPLDQLVCGIDSSRAGSHDYDIILHIHFLCISECKRFCLSYQLPMWISHAKIRT